MRERCRRAGFRLQTIEYSDSALRPSYKTVAIGRVNKIHPVQWLCKKSAEHDETPILPKRKTLADERDSKLATVLTADQMKKWKEEIEPSLRPQRPAGQGQ